MTARRKTRRSHKKTGGATSPVKRVRRKASTRRKSASAATRRRPSRARPRSLADRLTAVVEHVAAGALGRVVDSGGRELAAWLPEATAVRHEAGAYLRELREVAGLTIDELADAIELSDRSLLEAVETGAATLSFELILRLAAVLARHDPAPFISQLVRSYNPVLWQLLEDWGVGRLPLQLERERQFVNIVRGHDAARALSDEEFAQVLDFTRAAFEMALHFAAKSGSQHQP